MKKIIAIGVLLNTLLTAGLRPCIAANESKEEKRALFKDGAKLWPVYCSQCHNARPGSEFAPYQWNTILMHMRTQANLPACDARAIQEYLKDSH